MTTRPNVRRLELADAPALHALRREALVSAPLAFGSSPEDDRLQTVAAVEACFDAPDTQAVFGHLDAARLGGMVGVLREVRHKRHHQASVWGMYVTPAARGRGIGGALLRSAIEQARAWGVEQLQLCVTGAVPGAQRLYEAHGFREWGREPCALHWQGRFVEQHHLVLDLRQAGAEPTA